MDDVVEAAGGGDAVAPLDETLADALAVQGELGQRALGLLQDAHRLLCEPQGWQRPYETVVACCRGAMDSLLELSGIRPVGLKSAAKEVLLCARALLDEDASWPVDAAAQAMAQANLRGACEALAAEVENPGGYHSRRVRRVAERLTRRPLGVAEESASRIWSDLYGRASGVLHGSTVTAAEARSLFEELVLAATQVFVALPERSERIRELAALPQPSLDDAAEVAGWVDPRATEYFFGTAKSPQWLGLLSPLWLLPEPERWPAWLYLDRLAGDNPDRVADWLRENFQAIQDIGPGALGQAMRLAGRLGIRLAPQIQDVITDDSVSGLLQLAVFWAVDVPVSERDRSWITVVEKLINQVDRADRIEAGDSHDRRGQRGLKRWDGAQLLSELVRSAYPAGEAFEAIGMLRMACAGLLGRYLARPYHGFDLHLIGGEQDLSQVRLEDSGHLFVMTLARAVLDLALADARAGVSLADRTRALFRQVGVEGARDRVLATHLLETAPGPGRDHEAEQAWWACAFEVAERVVAGPMPHPDQAALIALLLDRCPSDRRAVLEAALTTGLGTHPDAAALERGRSQLDSTGRAPEEWSRLWAWATLLPSSVLEPWQATLAVLEGVAGGPPPDPRAPRVLVPWSAEDHELLALSGLAQTAVSDGPPAAAHRIASAFRTGTPGAYAVTIAQLVAIDPVPWAADVETIVQIFIEPADRLAYFQAVELAVRTGTTLESAALTGAIRVAHQLVTAPDIPLDGAEGVRGSLFYLLEAAWTGDHHLGDLEPTILDWLEETARATPSSERVDMADLPNVLYRALNYAGSRAIQSLICWGAHQARATGTLPARFTDLIDTILAADPPDPRALAIIGTDLAFLHARAPEWVERHADLLLTVPPGTISAARTWLAHGRTRPALLTALDRSQLMACLRTAEPDGAFTHTAVALLGDPQAFGPPDAFLRHLADAPDGPTAVSALLDRLARTLPPTPRGDAATWPLHAADIWRAAATANLPTDSLTGAGTFAYATALDDTTWLELTALTTQNTSVSEASMKIAERASRHPHSSQALAITAALLHHLDPRNWEIDRVRHHARQLLIDSKDRAPDHDRQALRRALVESGDIDAPEL
ncbi:hypothetical protein [Streptomyces mirabilis]|uniref:hypothetical protein n=1 Tax=Streptomyces mirabilis TaxID=68239 RepID=UPI0033ECF5CB